ncbi:dihydrofolate reductase family protein [Mycetocola reblochoni]|uniref:Dihydrofolate reductase homolog n=2 Tax=Mycetocola reblochoni TaxID=331618 RepID=A0A1R4K797_9MICO|nr:dihydrofolate reductase family protein [Mycetocola reblochoni]RLP71113.1 dihydrofolate reductase [Mycetocola reblochoni]SJN40118.1 Dihydrofolate reductase homolog [Mycetocola reblochoni REB411]
MITNRDWTGRVFIGVSLDGYIARPDGSIDWLTEPPAAEHAVIDSSRHAETWETFFPSVDTLVMGRGTYDTVAAFPDWPYHGKRVLVLSGTMPAGSDGPVTVVSDVDGAARALAASGAEQVYVDGGRTVQAFLRAGLIDEITLSRVPVILGAGRSLFGELGREVRLTLLASHASDGLVHASYRVER